MQYVLFYEAADDFLAKARQHGAAHRARLAQFHARGLLLAAGPLLDPQDGSAMGIFTSRQAAQEFISGDPFVRYGVVGGCGSAAGRSSSPDLRTRASAVHQRPGSGRSRWATGGG